MGWIISTIAQLVLENRKRKKKPSVIKADIKVSVKNEAVLSAMDMDFNDPEVDSFWSDKIEKYGIFPTNFDARPNSFIAVYDLNLGKIKYVEVNDSKYKLDSVVTFPIQAKRMRSPLEEQIIIDKIIKKYPKVGWDLLISPSEIRIFNPENSYECTTVAKWPLDKIIKPFAQLQTIVPMCNYLVFKEFPKDLSRSLLKSGISYGWYEKEHSYPDIETTEYRHEVTDLKVFFPDKKIFRSTYKGLNHYLTENEVTLCKANVVSHSFIQAGGELQVSFSSDVFKND